MGWWSKMWRTLKRAAPELEYMAIKEEGGTTGMRHLHLLVSGLTLEADEVKLVQDALAYLWCEYSGAWQVNLQVVYDEAGAGSYVSKHVGKSVGALDLRKIITYSKGWPKLGSLELGGVCVGRTSSCFLPKENMGWTTKGCLVQLNLWGEVAALPCDCFGEVLEFSDGPGKRDAGLLQSKLFEWAVPYGSL